MQVEVNAEKVFIGMAQRVSGTQYDAQDAMRFLEGMFRNEKIKCIVALRAFVPGLGLRSAKEMVEANLNLYTHTSRAERDGAQYADMVTSTIRTKFDNSR